MRLLTTVKVWGLLIILLAVLIFPTNLFAKSAYKKELQRWTRQEEVFQGPDFYASINWAATYQSPSFLKAKIEKMSKMFEYSPQKKIEVATEEQNKYGDYYSFFVSFYSYQYKYSDIFDKKSAWEIYLEVDGKRYKPVKHENLSRVTPLYQKLYPYSNIWSRHYYVYFPKTDSQDSPLKLIVTGPQGKSELNWKRQ